MDKKNCGNCLMCQIQRACHVSDLLLLCANQGGYLDCKGLQFVAMAARDMDTEMKFVEDGVQPEAVAMAAIKEVIGPFVVMAVEKAINAGWAPQSLHNPIERV